MVLLSSSITSTYILILLRYISGSGKVEGDSGYSPCLFLFLSFSFLLLKLHSTFVVEAIVRHLVVV